MNNDLKSIKDFAKNHLFANNSTGRTPFILKPHQFQLLYRIHTQGDSFIINKARQVGITSVFGIYLLWNILLDKDRECQVLIITPNTSMAKHIFNIIRGYGGGVNQNGTLPLMVLFDAKKMVISYGNNFIKVQTPEQFCNSISVRYDFIYVDEFGYIKESSKKQHILGNISRLLKKDGKVCISSTPNPDDKIFKKMFFRALRGQSLSIPIQLDWTVDEERDDVWRQKMNKLIGIEAASIEYDGLMTLNNYLTGSKS